MGFMSPQQLNDDPKQWLNVPHELHDSLSGLQEKFFPGFAKKLTEAKVHCLECENEKPFEVIRVDSGTPGICTGYIGDKGSVVLLNIKDTYCWSQASCVYPDGQKST